MGILLVPIFFGLSFFLMRALGMTVKKIREQSFYTPGFIVGPVASLALYGSLLLYWQLAQKVYALAPMLFIPVWCIGLPLLLAHVFDRKQTATGAKLSDVFAWSAIVSAVLLVIFNQKAFAVEAFIAIQYYH
jgi:uncharacterized transporter YbjL